MNVCSFRVRRSSLVVRRAAVLYSCPGFDSRDRTCGNEMVTNGFLTNVPKDSCLRVQNRTWNVKIK
jgi:hypothetical protein